LKHNFKIKFPKYIEYLLKCSFLKYFSPLTEVIVR